MNLRRTVLTTVLAVLLLMLSLPASAGASEIPRRPDGKPDLSGTYDVSTLTPLVRPREFGDNLELTPEAAQAIVEAERERVAARSAVRKIEEPPPPGGAPPIGLGEEFRETSGAGNVGGYNNFWTDRGDNVYTIDGKFRTSIIVDPKNGRQPPMTEAAIERLSERRQLRRPNDGTAWWVDMDKGPYDGPEDLGIAERCILGFTGSAPTYPSLYNNYKRIIQTDDHVMILIEMVHDARIVRLNSEHPPEDQRRWLGDSIGWWEGDTLVIDTKNFHPLAGSRGSSGATTHVVERFTRLEDGNLLYRFTVDDPSVWTGPWTGEYLWRTEPDSKVFEYACHEGNYSMGGILRGARLLEREALEKRGSASGQ